MRICLPEASLSIAVVLGKMELLKTAFLLLQLATIALNITIFFFLKKRVSAEQRNVITNLLWNFEILRLQNVKIPSDLKIWEMSE